MHILTISGSLRRTSYNKGLLRAAARLLPDHAQACEFDLGLLPLFNQDLEKDPPASVVSWKQAIGRCDGLLIATPEYNGSISGVLKNALDWASRPRQTSVLRGKPLAMMGAGGRRGTANAQLALRQQAGATGMLLMPEPELLVSDAWARFDGEGNLIDEATHTQLAPFIHAFVRWVRTCNEQAET